MTDYEILLMLDPELPEERQNEIVSRIREAVERDGRWEGHEPWGRPRAPSRTPTKAGVPLPPLGLRAGPGDARRDLARAKDPRRLHPPPGGAPRKGRPAAAPGPPPERAEP